MKKTGASSALALAAILLSSLTLTIDAQRTLYNETSYPDGNCQGEKRYEQLSEPGECSNFAEAFSRRVSCSGIDVYASLDCVGTAIAQLPAGCSSDGTSDSSLNASCEDANWFKIVEFATDPVGSICDENRQIPGEFFFNIPRMRTNQST